MPQPADSPVLFAMKHLWLVTPIAQRQELLRELIKDGPVTLLDEFPQAKQLWENMPTAAREAWIKWLEHESPPQS